MTKPEIVSMVLRVSALMILADILVILFFRGCREPDRSTQCMECLKIHSTEEAADNCCEK